MAFNPNVSDQRGQMAIAAGGSIADSILRGSQAAAGGIAAAGGSVAQGLAGAGQEMAVEKRRREISSSKLDFLVKNGVVTSEEAAKLLQGSTGKLEGAVSMGEAQWDLDNEKAREERGESRSLRYLDAQTKAAGNLATYKSSIAPPPGYKIVASQGGYMLVDTTTGTSMPVRDQQGAPVMPMPRGGGSGSVFGEDDDNGAGGSQGSGAGMPGAAPMKTPAASGGVGIPSRAIQLLQSERNNPQALAAFDAKYGSGAAARVLGQ